MHVSSNFRSHLPLTSTCLQGLQKANELHYVPSKQHHSGKAVAAEIDELNGIKDVTQLCLFYIDLQGEVQRLQVSLHAHIIHDLQPTLSDMHRQLQTR